MTSVLSHASHHHDLKSQVEQTLWQRIIDQLNFYRIHLLFFTFTPLVFSGVFYASNGLNRVSYIDSLFNCVSAMMVCGLATVNLSELTGFQQSLLFMQMCIGNPVFISWFIVYMRRYFFAKKFQGVLDAAAARRAAIKATTFPKEEHKPWSQRLFGFLSGRPVLVIDEEHAAEDAKKGQNGSLGKLRPDMIRRMDDAPKLVNPSGWVSEPRAPSVRKSSVSSTRPHMKKTSAASGDYDEIPDASGHHLQNTETMRSRRLSDPGRPSGFDSPTSTRMHRSETVADAGSTPPGSPKRFSRTLTVEFAPAPKRPGRLGHTPENGVLYEEPNRMMSFESRSNRSLHPTLSMPTSFHTHTTGPIMRPENSMTRGFGGFPSPFAILKAILSRLFPKIHRTLTRTVTIPATVSLTPSHPEGQPGKKQVPYISFDAIVGRNSMFHLLTKDQLEDIGGVEYRALNALLWIIACYHIGTQLFAFMIIASSVSMKKWEPVFQEQVRPLNTVWFSAFQVVSAYTNTGTSLIDQSLVPFQTAYPMIFALIFLILAGNTSFPIFLRFLIWSLSKIFRKTSRMHETLRFLLDHPRRCFIFLFPSHQTWFLLTVVMLLTAIDWISYLILDIHTTALSSIPTGNRVLDGLMQAVAVRAAGFAILPLAALAPAVQVLYVVMMYISVYPVAMSVRSTNVYEERSLGIFHTPEEELENDSTFEASGPRMNVWSRYLAMHARQQLAFDMWWLAMSLFIICIIERSNIEDPAKFGWFTIFRIIFELVSAYGTVGLSLGVPYADYSFVGSMHTLSKLVICLVMLRGRHRGLPVAIDRAVMLPDDFKKDEGMDEVRSHYGETEDVEGGRQFTRSETMNNRFNSDVRQRTRRGSKRTGDEDELNPSQGVEAEEDLPLRDDP